ncbi:DUF6603 domain-containing protein [Aurantiacibacter sp. MUD61]|uniref:DUF6603 domain-containing protein n=1 Tax=Aurantiacibacter sp. MUD61 TaxID=3009083 RepID=UPI0022F088C0|nr:DUF6603 domain-containing protein [Aurantiacibacter sp. MUD61]
MDDSTLAQIGRLLAVATQPITSRMQGGYARRFFFMLGVDVPVETFTPELETAFASTASSAAVLGEILPELIAVIDEGNTGETIAKAVEIVEQVRSIVVAVETIVTEIETMGLPGLSGAELSAFMGDVAVRTSELVLIEHLQNYAPVVFAILHFFGIVEIERANTGEPNLQLVEFDRKRFRFDRIETLFTSPGDLVADIYGWGTNSIDGEALISRLAALLQTLGLPASRVRIDDRPRLEVSMFSLMPSQGVTPPGLDAQITMGLSEGFALEIPVVDGMVADINARAAMSAATGISIRPPADIVLIPPSGDVGGQFGMGFSFVPVAPAEQLTLLGITGGTGLFIEKFRAGILADFAWAGGQAEGDVGFEAQLEGGKLKISADGADGFLADLLSGVNLEADFDVGVSWTAGNGIRFTGSHALTIQLPAHIDLGPIELDALTLKLGIDGGKFPIALATNINAQLGPLSASVEQIGGIIELEFPGQGGNAGPVNITGKFKPPVGAGLALDAGAVSGGGYLYFDYENGEYAGALELNLANIVAVKAIGIIATKMPDGSDGFSLLIVITAEFGTGIQLGFGFTLLGVGGILGLNRGMSLDALAEGVREGTLDNIMFPTDVVANAQSIIADLKKYFPIEADTFVIGPLAKIGWGTPTLVSLSLGVVIEIPPGNIAILGVLKVALPDEDAALLVIQVSFIGAIEFDKERAWFFASLFGSRVLMMTLEGEMGLVIAWGSDPNFVVSCGGFHPSYQPPPLPFPTPRRIAVSILNESWGRIRVEGYFAVTSNTVQFGAKLDIFFGFSEFQISGYLSLDALFQFSPFYMIVEIAGGLSLKVAGIDLLSVHLKFTLEGPTPWRAKGKGSVKILFFKISANFDETWGDREDTSLPSIPALPILEVEFAKLENWTAQLPPSQTLSTTLRELEATESLVLHPLGSLKVAQRAVPLDIDIDKVGNQTVSDAKRFAIESDSALFAKLGGTRDSFATGQYKDLSDSQKLSSKGYESQPSGLELGIADGELKAGGATTRTTRYELSVIDSAYRSKIRKFWGMASKLFSHFIKGGAVAQLAVSNAAKKRVNPFEDGVKVAPGAYAVANVDTNLVSSPTYMNFASQAEAEAFMSDQVASGAANANELHVVEAFEARIAA